MAGVLTLSTDCEISLQAAWLLSKLSQLLILSVHFPWTEWNIPWFLLMWTSLFRDLHSQNYKMLSRSFFIPSYDRFSLDSRSMIAWYPFVKHSIILSQTSQQAMLCRRCTCRLYIWNDRNEKQGWKIHGLGQENRQALALITPVWICVINLQVVNSTQTNFADIIA